MPIFECSSCNELTYSSASDAAGACARCGDRRHRVVEGDFTAARITGRVLSTGDHAALIHDDPARIAPFCARFLTEGVDAGQRVIAAVDDGVRGAVAPLLARDAELVVEWEDPRSIYGDFDPDRVVSMYEAMIAGESRTTRILAGIDAESAATIAEGQLDRYERLAHAVVTKRGATVVCLYDRSAMPEALIEVAHRRHTLSIEDGDVRRNERFEFAPA